MVLHPNHRYRGGADPWSRCSILPAVNTLPNLTDPSVRPNRRRLRRITEQWLPIGEGDVIARYTVFRHGGHQRPIIGRGGKHLRFRFPSTKTNTTQLGEGKGEAFLALHNEVWSEVADYECHPGEFEVMVGGKRKRYRLDAIRMFRDGTVEVIECKRTLKDLNDEEYRELLAVIAEICRSVGWKFRVLYLRDIKGSRARQMNVWGLYCRRTMLLTQGEERIAKRLVGNGAPVEWGDLRDRLAPTDPLRGDAAIERMLARGMLSTDLDVKFRPGTVLTPLKPFTGQSEIRV